MKQKLTLLLLALITTVGAWAADITVSPSTGVYWKNGAESSDAWAPIWKSEAKASDMTTPMLVLTGQTGMNTANGDIYSNQTYTLEAPSGYTIVSYTFNGTATGNDITITPAGGTGTTVTSGSSLSTPLSVDVNARTTTFTLSSSGDAHFTSLALTVKVEHYIVTYSTSTGSYTATNSDGSWASRWESTATDPQVTLSVGANNIQVSSGNIYSGSSTATYTLAAQSGYLITGYEIKGTAKTAAQTLTPAAGGSAVSFGTDKEYTLSVTGLSAQSTTFTQSTPNNGIAISSFKIYLEKDPCTATYVISDASGVIYTSDPFAATPDETITTLPSSLQRDYCTYNVTSTTIVAGENTVPVTVTYTLPFTVSSSFATATWYYATLRGKHLRADDNAKDGNGRYATNSTNEHTDAYKWAFFGNPYTGIYVMNKNQGDSKYLYKETQLVFKSGITPTSDNNALFAATANNNGGFTLRNIGGGATWYINDAGNGGNLGFWNSSNGANDSGSNWVITEVSASDKAALGDAIIAAQALVNGAGVPGYINSTAATTLTSAISTAQGVYDDPSGDYGSAYNTLAAAITAASVPANINYTPRTDVYYTIVNARGAMVYDPSHSSSVDTQNGNSEYIWYGSTTPDATNPNNLWGFIERDGNYYMYNVGKRQFASVGHGTYGSTWIFSNTPAYITLDDGIADEIVPPGVRVRATIATTGNSYTMSVSTNYTGPVITYDGNGDGGVPMVFAESSYAIDADVTSVIEALIEDLTPYRNALKDVIDGCAGIEFGSGLNQYSANATYTTALAAANAAYEDVDATKSELQTAKSNLESAISGLTINLPGAGFYRIKGNTSGNYLAAGIANSKYAMTSATDATTIFYYDGSKLTNLSSGMCNGVSSSSWDWVVGASASTVTFCDGHTSGGYGIQTANVYFYDGGTNADRGQNVNMESDNTRYRSWYLTEITTLPVTISAAGYATLYAPVALTIPSGVQAYYISSLTTTEATLTEIETTIAANTPVILKATAGTYDFVITTGGTDVSATNKLAGQVTAFAVSADDVTNKVYYTLQQNVAGDAVGLFPKTAAGSIAGFKAYLPAANFPSAGVKGFTFIFDDDATGINEELRMKNEESSIYNLAGQRINKMQKGINIVNGKKILK